VPVLTVIAGPNGSGKSTLTNQLVSGGINFGEYFNADDIAREMSGSPQGIAAAAQQVVREQRAAALRDRRSHCFETVMSHHSHIDYMLEARDAGFETRLFFVATEDPSINLDRVRNRVLHGGHPVPAERVIERYHRCLAHLPDAIRAASESVIYDNSSARRSLRPLAIVNSDSEAHDSHSLCHIGVDGLDRPHRLASARLDALPTWWLRILLAIKPDRPELSGPLT